MIAEDKAPIFNKFFVKPLRPLALYDLVVNQFKTNRYFTITERDIEDRMMSIISQTPSISNVIQTYNLSVKAPPAPPAAAAPIAAAPAAAAPIAGAPAAAAPAAAAPAGAPVAGAPAVADPTDASVVPRSSLRQLFDTFDAFSARRQPSQQPPSEEGRLAQHKGSTRLAPLGRPEEFVISPPATSRAEERESSVERATREQTEQIEQDESAILDGYETELKDNERRLEELTRLASIEETPDTELDR